MLRVFFNRKIHLCIVTDQPLVMPSAFLICDGVLYFILGVHSSREKGCELADFTQGWTQRYINIASKPNNS